MHPTDQTPSELVSGTIDSSAASSARRSGRRRADAGASVDGMGAGLPAVAPSASLSPRRAARAAREAAEAAAAAADFSAIVGADVAGTEAPKSPILAPTAALPIVPAAPAVVVAAAEVVAPAASVVVAPAEAVAPVAPTDAVAPAALTTLSGGLAVGIPAPAQNGRRETFVPAALERHSRPVRVTRASSVARRTQPSASVPSAPAASRRRRSVGTVIRRGAIGAVICGILATSILPVLGHTGESKAYASTNPDGSTTVHIGKQTYDVAAGVDNQVLARDGYSATSVLDYEKQVIANRAASTSSTYTGPTAADYVLHPLYSKTPLDRSQVFNVALQYLGTPYVHGGADPSAFDCSGFIMFVYAQFGISLPHYVPSQDAMGTTIPESEAVPGDLVVFNTDDHDGFYAGNGMIMDAPKPGGVITVRPIWSAPHHFVRINP